MLPFHLFYFLCVCLQEYGADAFEGGCPACKGFCCCNDARDTKCCPRIHHCYKKCPAMKNAGATGGGADIAGQIPDRQPVLDLASAEKIVTVLLQRTHPSSGAGGVPGKVSTGTGGSGSKSTSSGSSSRKAAQLQQGTAPGSTLTTSASGSKRRRHLYSVSVI